MNDFIMCALNKARKGYIHQSEIDKIFEELNFLSKSSYEYAPVKFEEVNADGLYIFVKEDGTRIPMEAERVGILRSFLEEELEQDTIYALYTWCGDCPIVFVDDDD